MLSIIVAMSANRVIGRAGNLPWHLPDDLKHFKALTTGHTVIMGRKTYDSVGQPLPNRTCIVVTRQGDYRPEGVTVTHSLDDALARTPPDDETFILGGGEIYRQSLPFADRLYITLIHAELEGDTFFPEFDESEWRLVEQDYHPADDRHEYRFTFLVYERTP